MTESQRNLLILVLLAIIGVIFSGAFNLGAGILGLVLNIAFAILIIAAIVMAYRRNATTIAAMPSTPKLVLYLSGITIIVVVICGMLPVPAPLDAVRANPAIMWGLIIAGAIGMWWAWQERGSRW